MYKLQQLPAPLTCLNPRNLANSFVLGFEACSPGLQLAVGCLRLLLTGHGVTLPDCAVLLLGRCGFVRKTFNSPPGRGDLC